MPADSSDDPALAWIRRVLADYGLEPDGGIEPVRVRPWSTVGRVSTARGSLWFKENGPGSRYEPAVMRALGDWVPGRVLTPLAVDTTRGWSLCPDGGPTLRDEPGSGAPLKRWEEMLGHHAELQRDLADRSAEMIALGLPDQPPELMPAALAALLDDPLVWAGIQPDRYQALRRLEPAFELWCTQLCESGVPVSIQHDDLHDDNVFADGNRFFDWGDASVSHPFGTLLVTLRSAAHIFGLPAGDPALTRLRDAYLEPWAADRDRAGLVETATIAVRVAKVGRSLAWQRALLGAGPAARGEYGNAVPGWIEELLEPDPV
ncbi:phosphotransferase [Wenjunlia tyrosinilytica]|uniref:phosphotransferase n=1 Tax=Wenjunlia tyrosinilytica TaxID=1544741 RepID=UPI00166EFE5C|nr:phosphotransferase [Wenjunlia tyrosinilytica]